jgi:hypothetical protein
MSLAELQEQDPLEQRLQDELVRYEREAFEAQAALGAAVLDGDDVEALERQLADARAGVERMRRALEARADRKAEEGRARAARVRAATVVRALRWRAERIRRGERLLAARRQLAQLEADYLAIGINPLDDLRDAEYRALVLATIGRDATVATSGSLSDIDGGRRVAFANPVPDPDAAVAALEAAAAEWQERAQPCRPATSLRCGDPE